VTRDIDLGKEDEAPMYWIIPAHAAKRLITKNNQIITSKIDEYLERWELLDG
jgi:hypothetical protein